MFNLESRILLLNVRIPFNSIRLFLTHSPHRSCSRIEKISYQIAQDYNDEPFVALCVLKGGYQYFNSLLAKVKQFYQFMSFDGQSDYSTQKITIEFIRVKSYEDDQSTGSLKVIGIENLENLRGKVISDPVQLDLHSVHVLGLPIFG